MKPIIILSHGNYENVISMPLLQINNLNQQIDLNPYDALIFTSKNAIQAINSINSNWKDIPSYCIAIKTADVVSKYQGNLEFIGRSSHGNDFAKELVPLLKNKKALYVRAKKTVSSLVEILKENNIEISELISYETVCSRKEYTKPPTESIIIFSSPSTVECFFKRFDWDESYTAIVIGNTTSKYLPEEINYFVSEEQSIESCIKLALSKA